MDQVPPKVNPNEYDQQKHETALDEFYKGVQALWDAGLTEDDIRRELEKFFDGLVAEIA